MPWAVFNQMVKQYKGGGEGGYNCRKQGGERHFYEGEECISVNCTESREGGGGGSTKVRIGVQQRVKLFISYLYHWNLEIFKQNFIYKE